MKEMYDLLETMLALRDPDTGCPWDLEQTIKSILPYTLEETYELAETIEAGDMQGLLEELGDLLFHIVFYARLADEAGHFGFKDIAGHINRKLRHRHPHVFGNKDISTAAEQTLSWEAIKRQERREQAAVTDIPESILDGISRSIPAVMRAHKLQKRASVVGFDWDDIKPVLDKIEEEIAELRQACDTGMSQESIKDELGDVMFACVNFARLSQIDPEIALRNSNRKFERRFRYIEGSLAATDRSPDEASLDEMEALWQEAKRNEGVEQQD